MFDLLAQDPATAEPTFSPVVARRGPTSGRPLAPRRARHLRYARLKDIYRLANAVAFAAWAGRRLSAHMTVVWNFFPGFRRSDWPKLDEHLIRLLRAFLERHGIELLHVYARENLNGRGPHTHFLVHIPPERWQALVPALSDHLHRGLGFRPATPSHAPIMITPRGGCTRGMVNDEQNAGVVRYLCKPLDPNEAHGDQRLVDFLGIKPSPHAEVDCRRIGFSENIGPSARMRAGWQEIATPEELRKFLNPPARPHHPTRRQSGP